MMAWGGGGVTISRNRGRGTADLLGMKSDFPNRRSTRLRGYDYTRAGAYYVTICTKNRRLLFGDVINSEMQLAQAGQVVAETWAGLPSHYHIELDAFVVMPNHIHAIILILMARSSPAHALSEIVRGFKTFSARRINALRGTPRVPVWQRGYHDHIIRDAVSLNRIRRYIADNPRRWTMDRENPNARRFAKIEPWERD
jgi:REP element-mobilizing transposase RayT